VYIKPRI